jgi:uncharacterized protein YbjT (DUF2867 family)
MAGAPRPGESQVRSALLAGATGLVGSRLLPKLLASPCYAKVGVWARRPLRIDDPRLAVQIVDFARLEERRIDAEDVYCCLGTTIRRAGTREAFREVDYGYPLALAKRAADCGARRLLVVSALGADRGSPAFYNRVKGEMEDAVRAAGVARTYFFRPSLLEGPRQEFRLGERVGLLAAALLRPWLGKYRPTRADDLALAMLAAASEDLEPGVYESTAIEKLAATKAV